MKPRNDCDTDELWEVERQPARTSIEVISEGAKQKLGFDLKPKKKRANNHKRGNA